MAKIRKILMLVENLPVPADFRVWTEAATLRDQGFQVSVICPKGSTQYRESYVCIDNISIYRYQLPATGHKFAAYIAEYGVAVLMTFWLSLKVLFRQGFDVIHTANPPDIFFIIGLFYRVFGKKFVFDQHDLTPEMFQAKFQNRSKPLRKLLFLLERCSYRTSHIVIVTNQSFQQIATERGCCPANKIFVVRNGPDFKRLRLATPKPELKKERRYLLAYVGVMGKQDGVEYALFALHDLVHKRGRNDVSLILMGDGDHASVLHTLVHELLLDEYVNFTGWIESNDIISYLTVADVGLSPDPRNGLNEFCTMIKTMEYMATGKPVVAFDLAETRFSAGDAALYAMPNVVQDFADKIEILLDDEGLRLKMGAIGRNRIDEELSWEHNKKNLILAYKVLFPGNFVWQ